MISSENQSPIGWIDGDVWVCHHDSFRRVSRVIDECKDFLGDVAESVCGWSVIVDGGAVHVGGCCDEVSGNQVKV